MKIKSFLFAAIIPLTAYADTDSIDDSVEFDISNATPFFGEVSYDYIGQSNFEKRGYRDQKLQYSEGNVLLGSIVYYRPACKEGLALSLSYIKTHLDWDDNPFFDQEEYNTLNLNLSGFSYRLCDWEWKGNIAAFIDADHWDFNHYLSWEFLLWGRYEYCDNIGIHFGLYAQTGMKMDRVYPVIGVDWNCYKKLHISAVFPVDISATWKHNDHWEWGAAVRFFHSKQRVGRDEAESRGVWDYRNSGVEAFATYHVTDLIDANVHAGYTTGGTLKVADHGYGDRKRYSFEGAPYIGGELSYGY